MKKILVIDNYDSFVHNAVQLLRESSEPVNITIQLNDRIDFEKFGDYDGILLSPGPGIPEEAGDLMAAIGQIVRQRIPVLGICLGHQALARAFGAELRQLSAPLHGHPTTLTVTDAGDLLLQKIAPPLIVGRYHSWVVDPDSMPEELIASSHDEAGHIMSFYHRNLPIHGVQFHPESCFVVQTSRLDPSCQFRPEQSAQIPLITKLIVSAENPSGRPTCGTATPRRQKVRRQCVQ